MENRSLDYGKFVTLSVQQRMIMSDEHTTAAVAAGLRRDCVTALSPPKSVPFACILAGNHAVLLVRWVLGMRIDGIVVTSQATRHMNKALTSI